MGAGAVELGRTSLPGVDANLGAVQALNSVGAHADQANRVIAYTEGQQTQTQRVIEGGNAVAELYKGIGAIQGEYTGSTDPEALTKFGADIDQLTSNVLKKVSPPNREYVASHLVQHGGLAVGKFSNDYAKVQRQMGLVGVQENAKTMATAVADALVAGDEVTATARMGTARGYLDHAEAVGLTNTKKGEATKQFDLLVKGILLDKMLVKDPVGVQQEIRTLEGQEKYGIQPGKSEAAINHVDQAVNRVQSATYQAILDGISKKQYPTQDQIDKLSGGQKLQLQNLMKSAGNEDDRATVLEVGSRVIQLKSDPTPENVAKGNQLYNEIISNPKLSVSTKLNYMNTVQTKVNGAQLNEAKFNDDYLLGFSKLMTPEQHKVFMIDYTSDPKGMAALKPGATLQEKMQAANIYALPYIAASRDTLLNKGKKLSLDSALGGSSGQPQPASPPSSGAGAFRPGLYQLNDGRKINIYTQEQYNKLMGR
jgi:hypothetical protein